jgi:AcrR family transcriptional regulator
MRKPQKRPARPRPYRSPLRQQLKADIRTRIVKAVVDIVVDEGVAAFTMQNVAQKAGVALRTVYRHFASRDQLLEALSDHTDAAVDALGLRPPARMDEVEALMRPLYERYFAGIRKELQASVVASIATGYRTKSHVARASLVRDLVAKTYPHLSAQELTQASAMFTVLSGSRVWFVLTAEFGLDAAQAGAAAGWGVQAFLEALKKRNDSASKSRK